MYTYADDIHHVQFFSERASLLLLLLLLIRYSVHITRCYHKLPIPVVCRWDSNGIHTCFLACIYTCVRLICNLCGNFLMWTKHVLVHVLMHNLHCKSTSSAITTLYCCNKLFSKCIHSKCNPLLHVHWGPLTLTLLNPTRSNNQHFLVEFVDLSIEQKTFCSSCWILLDPAWS